MNDSFLEDLELVPVEEKAANPAERYITTRHSNSPSILSSQPRDEFFLQQQGKSSYPSTMQKSPPLKEISSKRKPNDSKDKSQLDLRKSSRDSKHSTPKLKTSEAKTKLREEKLKPVENVNRPQALKVISSSKDRQNRSSGSRESSRLSDGSSKENSRPSDSSAEFVINSEATKELRRIPNDLTKKKSESTEGNDQLVMLNAIKEIVSGYTKMESTKIMRMMQDLYINSQANLMKQLLIMTDDLQDLQFNKDSSRVEHLVQENNRLLSSIAFLKSRVEEMEKIVEVADKLRQENTVLKRRINELQK